jgi:DNA invertase Pin-like site-specific DNA recombinase
MLVGYARVSTLDQNLALQIAALKKAGCKKIYEDQVSGLRTIRPGLQTALEVLRAGDTLVVWKLDRLGRSVKGLVDLVSELETRKVHFRSLTDSIDTSTPAGRFFFHVMASLAQMERELLAERTRAGLAAAKSIGRTGGRKRSMTDSKIASARKLLTSGMPPREVAKNLACRSRRYIAGFPHPRFLRLTDLCAPRFTVRRAGTYRLTRAAPSRDDDETARILSALFVIFRPHCPRAAHRKAT